jgi:thiol-disulfide isomerase/thioredoxin
MKRLKRVISISFICLALYASADNSDNLLIIDGHFFSEMPISSSEINGMKQIVAPNGTKAMVITLQTPLPEAALKYELPAKDVPDADAILKIAKNTKVMKVSFASPAEDKISIGSKFPKFTATDIDGQSWSNADVQGKVMVLNLWFTGCGRCRAEMPELSQWKDEMPDVMFFSATYEDAATARPVLAKEGFNWIPIVNDTQFSEWIDSRGYPLTVVVDKTGVITHIEHGTSPLQREVLRRMIQEAR